MMYHLLLRCYLIHYSSVSPPPPIIYTHYTHYNLTKYGL